MQYAEKDESFGEDRIACRRNKRCCGGHKADAPQRLRHIKTIARGQSQPKSRQADKGCSDGMAEPAEGRFLRQCFSHKAEIGEIPDDVEDEHGDKRQSARRIDCGIARAGCHALCHAHLLAGPYGAGLFRKWLKTMSGALLLWIEGTTRPAQISVAGPPL